MASASIESPLTKAINQFDAAEANVVKLERLWSNIAAEIPDGVSFGDSSEGYEENCRAFNDVLDALPSIDGWKPTARPMDLDAIGQMRFDAMEIGELECTISVERSIEHPGRDIREYRSRLNKKRRALIRDSIVRLIQQVDTGLEQLNSEAESLESEENIDEHSGWDEFTDGIMQIDALLGSSVPRPKRWDDISRCLFVLTVAELRVVRHVYWLEAKVSLETGLYGENEPLPIAVDDLSSLVIAKPRGPLATKLHWERLSPEDFERLTYNLINGESGYEIPQWLTRTNAADRGRDLSVCHVATDALCGSQRRRVIIQCRHQADSINIKDVSHLKEQMKLWEPPRVDVLIIATTGRFTTDAVAAIEKNNQGDTALRIEMWPESHMEQLLAKRPDLIAEFKLR